MKKKFLKKNLKLINSSTNVINFCLFKNYLLLKEIEEKFQNFLKKFFPLISDEVKIFLFLIFNLKRIMKS